MWACRMGRFQGLSKGLPSPPYVATPSSTRRELGCGESSPLRHVWLATPQSSRLLLEDASAYLLPASCRLPTIRGIHILVTMGALSC